MTRRLILSYLSLVAFVLVVLEIPLGTSYASRERSALLANLQRDASVVATFAEDLLERDRTAQLQAVARRVGPETGARVEIIDRKGLVVADSAAAKPVRADVSGDPEVADALRGNSAGGARYQTEASGREVVSLAIPVASSGVVYGAIRLTYPTGRSEARIRSYWIRLGLIAGVALLTATIVGWVLAASVIGPLRSLRRAAADLAEGSLTTRAPVTEGPPELRTLAHAFNDMATRIESLVGSQRAFIADASHQLRTPMTALRLRLENLEAAVDGDVRADVDAAIRETERLSHIVDGLLALARAEVKGAERVVLDIAPIVEERRAAWAALAEERNVKVVADVPEAHAWAVPGHLEQILDNLLANALEVAPAGTEVLVSVRPGRRWVELHVIDHGPGMTPEDRARAFDRFWRARSSNGKGTGLGLPIVRQLAMACGGNATLEPADGGGLDAVVQLWPASA